jgi:hypothetical protein
MTTNIKLTIATKAKGRHQSLDFCSLTKKHPVVFMECQTQTMTSQDLQDHAAVLTFFEYYDCI